MAEFALGLTKTAVEGTLSRALLAIGEEAKVKARVQKDLVFITGEFEMMQAFLNVANAERANNEVVRTWVRQLRDLAFDVEDCVEFVVHLDDKSAWWWRMVPSCISELVLRLQPLDQAAADIKLLKARVEEVSQRNTRYNLITDSSDKPVSPTEQPATASAFIPTFHILREVWETAGKLHGLGVDDLQNLIMSDDSDRQLQVMSVWSSAGADLGTTSILNKAYGDPEICQEFKSRAWVKLMHPFNRDEFRKSLLAQLYPNEQVNDLVQIKERYLVILDEVSTVVEWDAIRESLPDSKNGRRIIVSTRQLEIARLCTGEPYQVSELRRTSDGHSLCGFFKKGCVHRSDTISITTNKKNRMEEARDWIEHKNNLFGRKTEKRSLENRLRSKTTSVSVWGIAGVGKSALVRSIYYSRMLKNAKNDNDFKKFSWVDVPDQFNLMDLSRQLLLDFHSDDLQAKETAAIGIMEGQDPIQECCKILCQHRCLVVFDGLRSTHDWDLIKDAFLSEIHTTESCIVAITNGKNAAEHVIRHVPCSKVLNVKCLQAYAAHSLFTKVAPEHINGLTPEDMAQLSQLTIAKSGGLPKVIAALGKALWSATNTWHANNILDNYTTQDSLRGLFSWMQSYFTCSDSLKPCIFYLSVFPIGQDIRRRRLVTRWIAEGYSRDRFGSTAEDSDSSRFINGSTADQNGEKFFSDLIELSIIQQPGASNVCQVNGFFHRYIISRPIEDNLVFALEGRCNLNSQRTGQHLTIRSTWDRDINVFESIDFTRLRSLTVFGKWESFLISDKMKRLRVLDLEDTSDVTDEDLKQIVKLLTRLKFLSLRGCRGISRLPNSLDGMRQLQTLDVRHTSIVMLPPDICKLATLQYIRAGNAEPWYEGDGMVTIQPAVDEDQITTPPHDGGTVLQCWCWCHTEADNGSVEVPTGIGNLTALHTLGVVNVRGAGGKALLGELKGKLTQLRRLKVSGINRGNICHFFSAISDHHHLESLSVRLDEDVQDDIILQVPPQKTLRTLKLYGKVLNLPVWDWSNKFESLKYLDIEMTVTTGGDLRGPLEELVKKRKKGILRRLCVKLIQDDDLHLIMPNHECSNFQNLKIDCSSKLEVSFGESKLVKVLKVRCSSGSDLHFSGLENLNSLKEVWLMGDYGNTLKQELQQQLSNLPKKEKPVLKLVRPRCADDGY